GFCSQREAVVFAGRQRLLEEKALGAAANGGVDDEDPALIFAAHRKERFVVEGKLIAGDFDRAAIGALRNIEPAELDDLLFPRNELQLAPLDGQVIQLQVDRRVINGVGSEVGEPGGQFAGVFLLINNRLRLDIDYGEI